ncbi:exocyst complex component SEC6 isoform X1 [Vitis vinifera]|uniref:exocyst complex component SEC6 isoform X1 n=1 Tax=Vitis vinifera TaxID=29760 RepID=UPI00015CA904|nr:exocyst complex component SEC6 isoform X1 [Vitis vinifera]
MIVEDLGIEAKEAAVREVAKLLPLPELLQSISSIKADYITRQQANDAQLSMMVAEQVEQVQAGLESISSSQKTINQLRENFLSIERLCQECQNLIENHDQIKLLSNVRNNLNTTLKVNAMSDLCFHQLFLYHDMFLAYTHTNIHKFLSLYIYAHVIVQLQLAVY